MTLQFDNVNHSMDWTMHFSMWKWLILTVGYLVLHQWKHSTHSARGLVEMVSHVVIDNVTPQAKRRHWTALHCVFTKLRGKALQVLPIHNFLQ